MNKLNALIGRYLPAALLTTANAAALGSAAGLGKRASAGQAVDSYASKSVSASDLLGLQEDTDKATLRALMASNLLAAGHRTSMSIIRNIGK